MQSSLILAYDKSMGVQIFIRTLLVLSIFLLSFDQSVGLCFTLERRGEKFISSTAKNFERIVINIQMFCPEYAALWQSMELPFSHHGALIDSEWIIGALLLAPVETWSTTLGFLHQHYKESPNNPFGEDYEGPTAKFKGNGLSAYQYGDEVFLAYSAKPVENHYTVLEGDRRISKVAIPIMRYRGVDLKDRQLYLVSGVLTDEAGDVVTVPLHKNVLGFVPCKVEEGQNLSAESIKFSIESESIIKAQVGDNCKLTVRCSPKDIGGLILMRIKDMGPNEEQYQLVGIVTAVESDSVVKTSLCNQGLNSWVDNHIIKQACESYQ